MTTANVNEIVALDGTICKLQDHRISDVILTDQTPYNFRQTPAGESEYLKEIVGGTVAWNQLVQNGNFANTSNWSASSGSFSVSNNIATFTASAQYGHLISASVGNRIIENHKYLLIAQLQTSSVTTDIAVQVRNSNNTYGFTSISSKSTTAKQDLANIFSAGASYQGCVRIIDLRASGLDAIQVSNVMLFDLTAMFGSTIADYIYSLEQANAGAGVAWFRELFPEDYYAYDAGTTQSVKTSAHIMRDVDNNVIGNYALDNTLELRGIPKLDSNNQLYFDGDTYESDGKVTRRYGIVDLGELNWYVNNGMYMYSSVISKIKPNTVNMFVSNRAYTPNSITHTSTDSMFVSANKVLWIYDPDYTDAATFKTAMSGVYLVYELATPFTEQADPYQAIQLCDLYGTEEFVDAGVSASTRDVAIPVGHVADYASVVSESSVDGILENIGGIIKSLPAPPTTDGVYTLTATVSSGAITYSWET